MFLLCSAATPNVSIKAEMVQKGGSEFWVVSCVSSGGRPDTDISLVLNSDEEPQRDDEKASDTQTSSYFLPAAVYEGQNVTCTFGHPKFTHPVSKVTTLPSFCEYLRVFSVDVVEVGDETRTCSSTCRCIWSPVVPIRFGEQHLRFPGLWVDRAAGRTGGHRHRPAGVRECATLQSQLQQARETTQNSVFVVPNSF